MSQPVSLTFPDGSVREFAAGTTGRDVAESISKSLAKKAIAIALDGTVTDLSDPVRSGRIEIVTRDDSRALELIRHDAAHMMAEAVQELWPGTQVTIGPVVEDSAVWPNTDWWNNFNDAELSAFIEEVKANNLDLANNRRNLESAQIALREAGLARWPEPQLTIGDATGYSRTSLNGATVSRGNESNATQLAAAFAYSNILTKPATYARDLTDYDSELARAADVAMNTLGLATSTFFQLLLIRDRIVAARQNLDNAEVIGRIAQ